MPETALSVRHPWIQLILAGRRPIEVRGRATAYRGRLYLHASRTYGAAEREAAARTGMPDPTPEQKGVVLGAVTLAGCRLMTDADWEAAGVPRSEKRLWAWLLESPESVEPFEAKGERGLFGVELPRRKRGRAA
jgi:hypothetical protein